MLAATNISNPGLAHDIDALSHKHASAVAHPSAGVCTAKDTEHPISCMKENLKIWRAEAQLMK